MSEDGEGVIWDCFLEFCGMECLGVRGLCVSGWKGIRSRLR
jgi:hypothetical protein